MSPAPAGAPGYGLGLTVTQALPMTVADPSEFWRSVTAQYAPGFTSRSGAQVNETDFVGFTGKKPPGSQPIRLFAGLYMHTSSVRSVVTTCADAIALWTNWPLPLTFMQVLTFPADDPVVQL